MYRRIVDIPLVMQKTMSHCHHGYKIMLIVKEKLLCDFYIPICPLSWYNKDLSRTDLCKHTWTKLTRIKYKNEE